MDDVSELIRMRDELWREALRGNFSEGFWERFGPKDPATAKVYTEQADAVMRETLESMEQQHLEEISRMRRFLEARAKLIGELAEVMKVKAFHAMDCQSRALLAPGECDCGLTELQETAKALASTEALANNRE